MSIPNMDKDKQSIPQGNGLQVVMFLWLMTLTTAYFLVFNPNHTESKTEHEN